MASKKYSFEIIACRANTTVDHIEHVLLSDLFCPLFQSRQLNMAGDALRGIPWSDISKKHNIFPSGAMKTVDRVTCDKHRYVYYKQDLLGRKVVPKDELLSLIVSCAGE